MQQVLVGWCPRRVRPEKSDHSGHQQGRLAPPQGGCVETIHPTTHADPTYVVHDVIHYGVANMPGAVPRTSTFALTNSTFPYVEEMVELGVEEAVRRDPTLQHGANVWRGEIVCQGVAESLDLPYRPLESLL